MVRTTRLAIRGLIALTMAAAVTGSALAQEQRQRPKAAIPPIEQLGRGNDCTWARAITDWEEVDRNHIVVRGAGRDRFLIRFSGACTANPRFEREIGVISRDSRLCPYGGDELIIGGERCTILNIWQLPAEE